MPVDFPATRWSLIARLPDQPQQVAVLVGLYADAVGEYLRRRLVAEHRDRVDDIVQEVLARAKPGSGSRFRYYLMTLAWGLARNALRYERRRDAPSLDAAGDGETPLVERLCGDLPSAEQQAAMDRAWALSVLQQAFDDLRRWAHDGTLEPEAFAVLTANLLEGRPLREVAAATGLSLATCSRRLAQARQLLQQAIVERLQLAGEIDAGCDPLHACDVLLAAVASAP